MLWIKEIIFAPFRKLSTTCLASDQTSKFFNLCYDFDTPLFQREGHRPQFVLVSLPQLKILLLLFPYFLPLLPIHMQHHPGHFLLYLFSFQVPSTIRVLWFLSSVQFFSQEIFPRNSLALRFLLTFHPCGYC